MRPPAFLLLVGALAIASSQSAHYRNTRGGHLLNDPSVTPGDALPHIDTAKICQPGYTAQPGVRLVSQQSKDSVYLLYHATRRGDSQHPPSCCEVDHLISLELGGSNSIKNLWPEPYPDATEKDKVENALHRLVCTGKLSLRRAQRGIARNWVKFRDSLIAAGNWTTTHWEHVR